VSEEQQKLDVNWVQATAGALAAMSSAVLLSTVGVAGTIIGAAVGSVIATVGSTVYSHYLRLSRERVAAAARVRSEHFRARRSTSGPGLAPAVATDLEHTATLSAHETVVTAGAAESTPSVEEARATEKVHWRETLAGLPWKHIGVVSATLFVAAMVVIVAFELTTGRALSTYTGGTADHGARTSIPGLGGAPAPAPSHRQPTPAPTHQPSDAATTTAPDSTPTTPAPQQATTPTPASTPTPTPTQIATPTPTPTQTTTPEQAPTANQATTPSTDATAPGPGPVG
jgi:hypothetical protein